MKFLVFWFKIIKCETKSYKMCSRDVSDKIQNEKIVVAQGMRLQALAKTVDNLQTSFLILTDHHDNLEFKMKALQEKMDANNEPPEGVPPRPGPPEPTIFC